MLKNLAPIAATAIVLLFLLVSSVPLMHWFVREGREAELASGEELWNSLGISDYDFTVNMTCFCPPPAGTDIRLRVRNGRTISAVDGRNPRNGVAVDMGDIPDSVPAMFAAVRSAIDADPDSIFVAYDEDYGFPVSIEIDHRRAYADDEVTFSIVEFEPLDDISY